MVVRSGTMGEEVAEIQDVRGSKTTFHRLSYKFFRFFLDPGQYQFS